MKTPLLITGAGGFLGRHIVDALLAHGVAPEDVSGATRGGAGLPDGVTSYDVDLSLPDAARALIAGLRPKTVLHLAGAASVAVGSGEGAETAWRDNAQTTLTLASALRADVPDASILLASSAEVYGRALLGSSPTVEGAAPLPGGVYGRTKWAAEQILADVMGAEGRSLILRLFNSAGPGQDERFVVPAFAAQIARIEAGQAEPVLRTGNLDSARDFLDVRDTARAWAMLAETAGELAPGPSIFNVASGEARTIGSIVEDLRRMARRPFEVEIDPARARLSEIPRASGDSAKLRAATGWAPEISWQTTLADTLDFWRAEISLVR